MKDGRIACIEHLAETSDPARVVEAKTLFDRKGKARGANGFEIWDQTRFVYRFPPTAQKVR